MWVLCDINAAYVSFIQLFNPQFDINSTPLGVLSSNQGNVIARNQPMKSLGIKIDKNSSKDKKEQVMDWVDNDLGGYKWPTKIISRGKNKGLVKYEKFCYDMSDSYVICKAGIKINGHNR